MLLEECEGKELFAKFGIAVPQGRVLAEGDDLSAWQSQLTLPIMVKAQVLSGGRGKSGGVLQAATWGDVRSAVGKILGSELKGQRVKRVLLEEKAAVAEEYYLAIFIASGVIQLMIGTRGGEEVESVYQQDGQGFTRVIIDPRYDLGEYQIRQALDALHIDTQIWPSFVHCAMRTTKLFFHYEATLVEINPLARTLDGALIALDSKVAVDDGALFRQQEIRDIQMSRVPRKGLAQQMYELDIQYTPLEDGNIGLVNSGAGAGVAIMDWVAREGARLSAFVDLDYAVMNDKTEKAIELVYSTFLNDINVKSIIVNFTSCGLRLDEIAESLLRVFAKLERRKPTFINLQGNRQMLARAKLEKAGIPLSPSLRHAVLNAVSVSRSADHVDIA
jgi:succinyl-CoA synthetase beta subunit